MSAHKTKLHVLFKILAELIVLFKYVTFVSVNEENIFVQVWLFIAARCGVCTCILKFKYDVWLYVCCRQRTSEDGPEQKKTLNLISLSRLHKRSVISDRLEANFTCLLNISLEFSARNPVVLLLIFFTSHTKERYKVQPRRGHERPDGN
jgi:hypothetical protein